MFLVFFRDLKLTKYAVFFNSSVEEHWLSIEFLFIFSNLVILAIETVVSRVMVKSVVCRVRIPRFESPLFH